MLTLLMGCATAGDHQRAVAAAGPKKSAAKEAPPGDAPRAETDGKLRVTFLDVGQGDGILIVSPTGKSVLIDAGLKEAAPVVAAAIREAGVKKLDLVIGTHAHADHIGGITEILKEFGAGAFMDPAFPHPSGTYRQLLEFLEVRKIPKLTARKGRQVDLGGGATLSVLGPRDDLLRGTRSDANTNSVIARLVFGEVSVLLTGDAEKPTEKRLLSESGANLTSTVLKVAHHGSAHSSTAAFLDAVQPKAAVISAGLNNRYGHPTPETLQRLAQRKITVHRTDLHGHLVLETDGRTWKITALGKAKASEQSVAGGKAPPPAGSGGLLDINTADADSLTSLPGIGPKKAAAIVSFRDTNGRFRSVDDIVAVRGIGAKTLEKLRPHITASPPPGQEQP